MKHTTPINASEVLSLFLPSGILDYFEITGYHIMDSCYVINLSEQNIVPEEYSSLHLVSKGFFPEISIQDFPVRGRSVYLNVCRRRWEDKDSGTTYSRDWSLVASGTRITAEFGAFLKGLP